MATETTAFAPRATSRRLAEGLVFSSVLAAVVGASLVAVVERTLYQRNSFAPTLLVFLGTLAVYNVDRLRDRTRDRDTAPQRTRFVDEHEAVLGGLAFGAGAGAIALALFYGPSAALAFAPIVVLGLFHRRLKRWPRAKAVYVALAWTGAALVAAQLASFGEGFPDGTGLFALFFALSVLANTAVAGSQRGRGGGVQLGFACALAALLLALSAPSVFDGVAWLPAGALLGLLWLPEDEWLHLAWADAALGAGALAAWLALA